MSLIEFEVKLDDGRLVFEVRNDGAVVGSGPYMSKFDRRFALISVVHCIEEHADPTGK